MLYDHVGRVVGQGRQFFDELGIPGVGESGYSLTFLCVRPEDLSGSRGIRIDVDLTGPDHWQPCRLEPLDQTTDDRHRSLGRLDVHAGDAEGAIRMDESVLGVDDDEGGVRLADAVECAHLSFLSTPRTPARAQFSSGYSEMAMWSPSGLAPACSTMASVIALVSWRFCSTVRPSHMWTCTNGICDCSFPSPARRQTTSAPSWSRTFATLSTYNTSVQWRRIRSWSVPSPEPPGSRSTSIPDLTLF